MQNILSLINYQKPSYFKNFENAKKSTATKTLKNANWSSNYNTINYVRRKSCKIASLINLQTNSEKKREDANNFDNYINQTNKKNNNLIKINFNKREGEEHKIIYKSNLENFQNSQRAKNEGFLVDIPTRLKDPMDLLIKKTSKIPNEMQEGENGIEHFNNDQDNSSNSNIHLNHKIDNKRISLKNEKNNTANLINNKGKRDFKSENKKEDEKIFISSSHAAKIKMLKELDLKGNKKKSDAYLSVKCVGLKADFRFNSNISNNTFYNNFSANKLYGSMSKFETIKVSSNNIVSKNNGMKRSSSGIFPNINKK